MGMEQKQQLESLDTQTHFSSTLKKSDFQYIFVISVY